MKIALDVAAGDYGLLPNIRGAVIAAEQWGIDVTLVGPAAQTRQELAARGIPSGDNRFEIVDCDSIIAMAAEPAAACRSNRNASIMVCAELAAKGRTDGMVSAGNSGAAMVSALWHLRRLPDILRPAIAVPVPTLAGMSVLLDAGANVDSKPWHLLQFAIMGSIYARHILKIERPRVGLLSIGEEKGKGNDLVKETFPLLKCSGLNFFGMVEGRDIPAGGIDVIVCDGFVGNVAVKLMEGMGLALFKKLKGQVLDNLFYKFGGWILSRPLGQLKKMLSYDEYGGAPLLGVNGNVVICHGKSNAKAVAEALRVAKDMAGLGVNEQIKKTLADMKLNFEMSGV
ncbi:MAG: hypothetical protein A3J74_10910 [Elusimicrobia bacterium RIFCSPHIGHO2_02_FULL_57_9]|nr:MAG: hypothetical protein A3J74_10910 [Elusimicrobia bacterium RIFCSPHIGHO2_02_FULL_57_9]